MADPTPTERADRILVGLERRSHELGCRAVLANVRERIGDTPADSAWVRMRTTIADHDYDDLERCLSGPAEDLDEELLAEIRLAAGAGAQGLELAREVLTAAVPYLAAVLERLDGLLAAHASLGERRPRRLVMRRNRAAKRLAVATAALEEGAQSPLVREAVAQRLRISVANAAAMLDQPLRLAVAERRPDDFRLLAERARLRWPDPEGAEVRLNPLRRLWTALDAGQLGDDALEPAMRMLQAIAQIDEDDVPLLRTLDIHAPHELAQVHLDSLGADRLLGAAGLVHQAGVASAPYYKLRPVASAPAWRALAAAALDAPATTGAEVGCRQLYLGVVSHHIVAELEEELAPFGPELRVYRTARISTTESAVGLRLAGTWAGEAVVVHAVIDLGVNTRGLDTAAQIEKAIRDRRVDARYATATIEDWDGTAAAALSDAPAGPLPHLEPLLRTRCRHTHSTWVSNRAEDAKILVCPGCGGSRLAIAEAERLPGAADADADPAQSLARARFHAAIAGAQLPVDWRELVAAAVPADLEEIRRRVIEAATPRPPERRRGLRQALAGARSGALLSAHARALAGVD